MADFKYKLNWIPDSKKLSETVTPAVEPQGIASRPAPAQDKKEDMDFYTKMYEIMSAYFDTDEEAEQVLSSKKPDAAKAKQSTMEEYGRLFMYATEPKEPAPVSEDPDRQFSGSGVSIEDRFPETNLSDTIADESTAPLSEVDPERRDDEEFLRTGEPPSEGLMSKPLTDDDMGLPDSKVPAPDLAFIKNAGTKQGDNERSVYEYAFEQGLEGDELKSFMSQVAHESRTFSKLEEGGYTRANVNDISTARYKVGDTYKGQPLTAGDPMVGKFKNINRRRMVRDGVTDSNGVLQNYSADNVHNSMYADRMGNGDFASGDGSRYKGRGYIQLTGRDNYRLIGEDIGEDLENNPDLMLDPKIAEKASVAWWKRNVQTRQPDYTDVEAVTRIVNGGVNGLADRRKKFNRYNETVTTPTRTPRPQARN
jgi:predicted chitinase